MPYDIGPKFLDDIDILQGEILVREPEPVHSEPNREVDPAIESEAAVATIEDKILENFGRADYEDYTPEAAPGHSTLDSIKTFTITPEGILVDGKLVIDSIRDDPDPNFTPEARAAAIEKQRQMDEHFAKNPGEPYIVTDYRDGDYHHIMHAFSEDGVTGTYGNKRADISEPKLAGEILPDDFLQSDAGSIDENDAVVDLVDDSSPVDDEVRMAALDATTSFETAERADAETEEAVTPPELPVETQVYVPEIKQKAQELIVAIAPALEIEESSEIAFDETTEVVESKEVIFVEDTDIAISNIEIEKITLSALEIPAAAHEIATQTEETIEAETVATGTSEVLTESKDEVLTQILTEIFSEPLPIIEEFVAEVREPAAASRVETIDPVQTEQVVTEVVEKITEEKFVEVSKREVEEGVEVVREMAKQEVQHEAQQKVEVIDVVTKIEKVQQELQPEPVAANDNIEIKSIPLVEQGVLQEEHATIDRFRAIEKINFEELSIDRESPQTPRFTARAEGVRRSIISPLSAANDEDASEGVVFRTSNGPSLNGITMQRAA